MKILTTLLLIPFVVFSSLSVEACTGMKINVKNNESLHGRTFEFGVDVNISLLVIPRNYSFMSASLLGEGMPYQAKYAVMGMACFNQYVVLDGMNEKGLSVGSFYFPGFASYTKTTQENNQRSLSPIDFPNWLLTQFATLEEVKEGIKNVVIAPTIINEWSTTSPPPFHYIVYDKSGNSLVIEPLDEKLVVSENPIGVFTNSPTFNWHMTNLRNFINLSPNNIKEVKIDGIDLKPFGQGSGMVGLPGDFTPPSRFVRAAIYSMTAIPVSNTQEGISQLFHLLNQFDIPKGLARDRIDDKIYSDYTLATVVHNPSENEYYYKTYQDQTIKVVKLKNFDLNASGLKILNVNSSQEYKDVSAELREMSQ